jgi:hypothetical protein
MTLMLQAISKRFDVHGSKRMTATAPEIASLSRLSSKVAG